MAAFLSDKFIVEDPPGVWLQCSIIVRVLKSIQCYNYYTLQYFTLFDITLQNNYLLVNNNKTKKKYTMLQLLHLTIFYII